MRLSQSRLLATTGALLACLASAVVPTGVATAAVTCAPDGFEIDDTGAGAAPIAVGTTVDRAICQERTPLPGKRFAQDADFFEFTAVEGQAYTVDAVDVGSALVNSSTDRGGIALGLSRLNADGTTSGVDQNRSPNEDRVTTGPLAAGRYRISAGTSDLQVYPDNVLTTKTIEGDAGRYGVWLSTSAPAPVVTSLTISPNRVNGGKPATATLTFSAPIPAGGSYINLSSSNGFAATATGSQQVPAGATRFTVAITTGRVSTDTPVTFTGLVAFVGQGVSTVLTVRK
ncbi:hypothetical protein [Umezawaea sp. Da 62-37]|uniref:hypothetical protein n=1 Tax=Umezawaea sp. Da 62-37 TaxID=3075927 RepID=UPI0028F7212D|nr:hypothetical protein [Umezawaea sp. Da 62-37]WNV87309.1 hypothetical protein RM788_03135 [Umezawaea sp. Da 62-37]